MLTATAVGVHHESEKEFSSICEGSIQQPIKQLPRASGIAVRIRVSNCKTNCDVRKQKEAKEINPANTKIKAKYCSRPAWHIKGHA
jgi:hypothetical protein